MNSLSQRLRNYFDDFGIHTEYLKTTGKGRKEFLFQV